MLALCGTMALTSRTPCCYASSRISVNIHIAIRGICGACPLFRPVIHGSHSATGTSHITVYSDTALPVNRQAIKSLGALDRRKTNVCQIFKSAPLGWGPCQFGGISFAIQTRTPVIQIWFRAQVENGYKCYLGCGVTRDVWEDKPTPLRPPNPRPGPPNSSFPILCPVPLFLPLSGPGSPAVQLSGLVMEVTGGVEIAGHCSRLEWGEGGSGREWHERLNLNQRWCVNNCTETAMLTMHTAFVNAETIYQVALEDFYEGFEEYEVKFGIRLRSSFCSKWVVCLWFVSSP